MAEIGHVSSDNESISWNTICAAYKPTWLRTCETQAAVAGTALRGFPSLWQVCLRPESRVSSRSHTCQRYNTTRLNSIVCLGHICPCQTVRPPGKLHRWAKGEGFWRQQKSRQSGVPGSARGRSWGLRSLLGRGHFVLKRLKRWC